MVDPRTPCLIGVAQQTWRPHGPTSWAPEPLDMWEAVARTAAADAGSTARLLRAVDSVRVVYCMSWPYDDPPGRLAERLGVPDGHRLYSGIGGTTPQALVGDAARGILQGEHDLVLIAGAEALDTRRRLRKQGERPRWSHRNPEKVPFPFEAVPHPSEITHEVFQAWLTFPLFDIARRARLGVSPQAYREELGRLLEPMSATAWRNPHAWFPVHRSAEELITPTDGNRLVGYPYTKYMISVLDVDMAGALLLASEAKADELGVPRDRRVYLRGWAYGTDVWNIAERQEMWRSPAMELVSTAALRMAGIGIDDVAHLDLYSCFASSILLALDALGMAPDDTRPLTVTGGLPFAGGAGSNYMLGSIASMAERLRDDAGSLGLVSGVGMHMTKHVYAAYSTAPPTRPGPADEPALQQRLDSLGRRTIRESYVGPATIAAYTVAHGRDGAPESGLAICDLPDGDRCYARLFDAEQLALAEAHELVGSHVDVVAGDNGMNVVKV